MSDVWFYRDASKIGFQRTAFENVNDITFHAYADKADALKEYVDRYSEERGFSFEPIDDEAGNTEGDASNSDKTDGDKASDKGNAASDKADSKKQSKLPTTGDKTLLFVPFVALIAAATSIVVLKKRHN